MAVFGFDDNKNKVEVHKKTDVYNKTDSDSRYSPAMTIQKEDSGFINIDLAPRQSKVWKRKTFTKGKWILNCTLYVTNGTSDGYVDFSIHTVTNSIMAVDSRVIGVPAYTGFGSFPLNITTVLVLEQDTELIFEAVNRVPSAITLDRAYTDAIKLS